MKIIRKMTVRSIDDQGDRVLLYGTDPNYHVIAEAGCQAEPGDTIEYEPYGFNFGWYVATAITATSDGNDAGPEVGT